MQSVLYHCAHLEEPRAPLPPSYPSSFADFAPLNHLYFCEECDAIRCDDCVAIEVASYYCPNCLFDVPGANVRADKSRCARSCFSCPECSSCLNVLASEQASDSSRAATASGTSATHSSSAPYLLSCPACKWSSKEIGWKFDKPTSLASQLSQVYSAPEDVQAEFDALKDHLEGYISQSAPPPTAGKGSGHHRTPSRHIAQITQAAARALRREVPGMGGPRTGAAARRKAGEKSDNRAGWDQLAPYEAKDSWKEEGLQRGVDDVDTMRKLTGEEVAPIEKRWTSAWEPPRMSSETMPQRIPLQAKLTKRCPHPTCRHILIQPDTKTVRMLIKMVGGNYLPAIELGRRRRRLVDEALDGLTEEELERRRRERRRTRINLAREEDEDMTEPLHPGEVYTFQLAFTNPLYDPVQVRLGAAHQPRGPVQPSHHIFTPTAHFTVGPLKDAWAYDEEDEDDNVEDDAGTGGAAGHGGDSVSERAKARMSLAGLPSSRHRGREAEVEKRGNVTKVGLEVEVLPGASGPVEFDLEIRFTYRADDAEGGAGPAEGPGEAAVTGSGKDAKEEYKTFTFWTRVCAGEVL